MNRTELKIIVSIALLMTLSCNEPETVVTNYIHADGSVTRRIEMRNVRNEFVPKDFQVPFDSTWLKSDSIEISTKGDTTWIKRAEKTFPNVESVNSTYREDSTTNGKYARTASFDKKFKWFNTEYRFSERVGRIMQFGYPLQKYMNASELLWFYSPQELSNKQLSGRDSLKYKALRDSVDKKTEEWIFESTVSEWIGRFSVLTAGQGTDEIIKNLREHEKGISTRIKQVFSNQNFDSLWSNGIMLKELIGEENANKYRNEADSALNMLNDFLLPDFKAYKTRAVLPGKLTDTNGFVDSVGVVLWPVSSDFFLTQDYEMWAESKTTNTWAWVISALFVIFVITGVIIKTKKG